MNLWTSKQIATNDFAICCNVKNDKPVTEEDVKYYNVLDKQYY